MEKDGKTIIPFTLAQKKEIIVHRQNIIKIGPEIVEYNRTIITKK